MESNGTQNEKISKIVGIIAIIAGLAFLGLFVFVAAFTGALLLGTLNALFLGIGFAVFTALFMWKVDTSKNLRKKTQVGKFNLRWLIIALFSLAIIISGFMGILYANNLTFDTLEHNITEDTVKRLFVYAISAVALSITFWIIYLGVKNLARVETPQKIKQGALVFLSTIMIVAAPVGGYFFMEYGYFGDIEDKYPWVDGPYLTWDDDPQTTMVVSWLTDKPSTSKVIYGTDPELENAAIEETLSQKAYLHHMKLENLSPGTTYYYSIDENFPNFENGAIYNFTTAPSDTSGNYRFCVVGDMQPNDDRTKIGGKIVAQGISAENPDFVVQLGDLSSTGASVSLWHNTLGNIPYFASGAPIQSAVGNHDYGGDGSDNYRTLFSYDYVSEEGNYYSFNYANAHFVMVDNFVGPDSTLTQAQKDWIVEDIETAKADGQEWIFINFHHTIMTTGTSGHNWELQKWLVPVADKYDVDGVFFGHDHHYEHWNYTYGSSGLLYNETDNPSGNQTNFWCSGGGGAHLEVDYGVLTHDSYVDIRKFYNVSASEYQDVKIVRKHWNASRYVDLEDQKIYADSPDDFLYYHAPELESYSNSNDILGYDYGEQTLHYMLVEVSDSGKTCTISARYPDGTLLTGPSGNFEQSWIFQK